MNVILDNVSVITVVLFVLGLSGVMVYERMRVKQSEKSD